MPSTLKKEPVSFIWIGNPAIGVKAGMDTLGPLAYLEQGAAKTAEIYFFCLKSHLSHYESVFEGYDIKVCGIESELEKKANEKLCPYDDADYFVISERVATFDPEYDFQSIKENTKTLQQALGLTTIGGEYTSAMCLNKLAGKLAISIRFLIDDGNISSFVIAKQIFALYLLYTMGGHVLDTNVFPDGSRNIIFKRFSHPVYPELILDSGNHYNEIWTLYAPPPFLLDLNDDYTENQALRFEGNDCVSMALITRITSAYLNTLHDTCLLRDNSEKPYMQGMVKLTEFHGAQYIRDTLDKELAEEKKKSGELACGAAYNVIAKTSLAHLMKMEWIGGKFYPFSVRCTNPADCGVSYSPVSGVKVYMNSHYRHKDTLGVAFSLAIAKGNLIPILDNIITKDEGLLQATRSLIVNNHRELVLEDATLLHFAVFYKNFEVVNYLIEKGADTNKNVKFRGREIKFEDFMGQMRGERDETLAHDFAEVLLACTDSLFARQGVGERDPRAAEENIGAPRQHNR